MVEVEVGTQDKASLKTGDCGAEVAPIHHLNKRYKGELTVLWLDAHADLNTPTSSPSSHFHGMPLRLLLDGAFDETDFALDTRLTNHQVVFVGLRDTDATEDQYIAENDLAVLTDRTYSQTAIARLLDQRETENVYIHLDLDILNPLLFSPLQYPTPGGLEPETVAQLIRWLTDNYAVVGLSLTETTADRLEDLGPIDPILSEYRRWLSSPDKALEA